MKELIEILNMDTFYGVSKDYDIAKGVNRYPATFKQKLERNKRLGAWQSN